MSKKRKPKMEYRYYDIPNGSPVLALLGEKWVQNYGRDIDYLHFHNHLEIGYCYQGEGILTLEEEELRFRDCMFTVIPKNFPHTTNSLGDTCSAWEYLFIDADGFLAQIYGDNMYMAERLLGRINRKAHLAQAQERPQISDLICQIIEAMRGQKDLYHEEVKGLTMALLIQIARWNREEDDEKELTHVGNSTIIARALDYISEYPDRQIKIEQLAELCHISETHFRRVFGECMNMTPVEYINHVRIKKACDELKRTNDSVGSIAARAGFATLSTFNRNFRRILGISPQQWRKNPEHYERKLLNYDIKTEEGW